MTSSVFKKIVFIVWLVLLGMLAARDLFIPHLNNNEAAILQKARQERYYGVWFNRERIGYIAEKLTPAGNDFMLNQNAHLLLNVMESTQPVDMRIRAKLSNRLVLKDFTFHFRSPFYIMTASGSVHGKRVNFRLDTGATTVADTITLDGPPILAVNDRSYLLSRLTKPGQKIKVPFFDPVSLSGRESVITYRGEEKVLIHGRLKLLRRYLENAAGMQTSFWLDDSGRVAQEESPAGFKLIAEPEFRAKDIARSGSELLGSVAIPLKGPRPPEGAQSITYRLTMPPNLDLDLQGGRQVLQGNHLIIHRETVPGHAAPASGGACADPKYLKSTPYVQAGNRKIVAQAQSIVGTETDPAVQVRLLLNWVYHNLEKRPVIGLPDALTTLKARKGDCNEHASLFAALARSIGIPTAIVTGVTLLDNEFYYHAWNEVCLSGAWYSLDTTTAELPADLFHIRFGRGDMESQLKIGSLLGKLGIEIVPGKGTSHGNTPN